MDDHAAEERPYRSHLRPACLPCRRRKSRCQTEANASACLMCKLHGSDCYFPDSTQSNSTQRSTRRRQSNRQRSRNTSGAAAGQSSITATGSNQRSKRAVDSLPSQETSSVQYGNSDHVAEEPLGLGAADDENLNLHIVGPATTDDSRVLTHYLAGVSDAPRSSRMVAPVSSGRTRPILFTAVQKRPLGIATHPSPSAEKLEIIEKLLEPNLDTIIDAYFHKINKCMPVLDEGSFRRQFQQRKEKISPALLACLYAHMVVYCTNSHPSINRAWPDGRFIWNLANEALYSELHLSPGVSIITAILLNVGGRPTTSLVGNGVLLSSAVSIAHSLGLNRNPLDWDIPTSEKYLRMRIWWVLFVQDKWTSLAHGTPPRITQSHQDVPPPTVQHLCHPECTEKELQVASIFIALVGLTGVLDVSLQQIYNTEKHKNWSTLQIELPLHTWVDSLRGIPQRIVVRGSNLDLAGASNLRLTYLSMKLLLDKIKLESAKQVPNNSEGQIMEIYLQGRQSAEQILGFTQNLQATQLNGFWLSAGAFTYPSTVNFLLRHALETEGSPSGLAQTSSFQLARQFVDTLRLHKEKHGWDMGDVCLAQHAEIVDKVLANAAPNNISTDDMFDLHDLFGHDAFVLDQYFSGLWDTPQNF
ncbi:hypothetical protein LLEC1_01327 [Akanthomyces lecanii]|uniref:Zn(2)-C6 fungal-type domain-containing protein n=1 Tax=Cordyceps confragosa TaxID=2714763 RepID=A0A179IA64_CORDF|nr:hypothetical protein LLEC1_01327 [Akanthomyces lecanii]